MKTSSAPTSNEETGEPVSSTRTTRSGGLRFLNANPSIVIVPLLVLAAILASGFGVAYMVDNSAKETERDEALVLAKETGAWFSSQLDQALLPVFSLAQFVSEVNAFSVLHDIIGPAEGNNSLPLLNEARRNVTGVCDDPQLLQRFNHIAETIKRNAGMNGVLVSLQLAPQAVVCLAYPLNNTEDFPEGVFMDNSGVIGHDLLNDPARSFIAEQTVPGDDMVIAGPLELQQCRDTCSPTVKQGLIARMPIYSRNQTMTVNGQTYQRWGFAVGIINWNALVERSDVYEVFQRENMEFQLTRTDRIRNDDGGEDTENVVVLAETSEFKDYGFRTVTTALETTNNEWEITVAYGQENHSQAFLYATVATAIVAVCIAGLVVVVLVQKKTHADMSAEQTALLVDTARQTAVAERDLNDFIAHEVRNPLSAALSACTFVSTALNEKEPLVTEESKQAVREDLHIIDSSLHFINDLLRSMLDIHRAAQQQLTLRLTATDVMQDILEPVVSMLYQRDEAFEVLVECDPGTMVVQADRLRLQQVVLNLARNSLKFVERGFVRIRASVVDGDVCIFVEDSGPGIPMDKRKNLFCRFQESLDSLTQGTGVGLNLCKTLVDLMGGELVLDESYDSGVEGMPGSRIIVNLKRAPDAACDTELELDLDLDLEEGGHILPPIEEPEPAPPPELPENLSVLFVDDDRILRKLANRSLAKAMPTWTVREAASGETALHLLESETFHLIFMDQYMTSVEQALKGTETIRALRARGIASIVCGLSANDLEPAFLSAGADAFLLKPFPCKGDELKHFLAGLLRPEVTSTGAKAEAAFISTSPASSGTTKTSARSYAIHTVLSTDTSSHQFIL